MNNTYLFEALAFWFLMIYIIGYHFFLKRLFRYKNSFARIKPLDCYFCINIWTAIALQYFFFQNWDQCFHDISLHVIAAGLIQHNIEGGIK